LILAVHNKKTISIVLASNCEMRFICILVARIIFPLLQILVVCLVSWFY